MLKTKAITQIATTNPAVHAFRVRADVDDEDMAAMAGTMNEAFDERDAVSMLLILEGFDVEDSAAGLNVESLKAQVRSLRKVEKYAVVGAPDSVRSVIEGARSIMPGEARTFHPEEEDEAWAFVDARPA